MRKRYALACLVWAFPAFAPDIPPLPPVTDDRESIRRFIGALEMRFTIQSNIFAGMAEHESGSSHRTNRDPSKGVKRGDSGEWGVTQIVEENQPELRKVFGSNFFLTNLADNLMGGAYFYQYFYLYYIRKGWNHRESTLRAIQAFNCGIVGSTWKSRIYRRRWYLHHVLYYAEGTPIPRKYR